MGGKSAQEMRYGGRSWLYSMGKTHMQTDKFFDHYFLGIKDSINHFSKQFDKYLKLWEEDYKFRKKKDGRGGGLIGTLYHFAPHFFDFKVWKKLTGQARKPEMAVMHQIRDILFEMLPKKKQKATLNADPMDLFQVFFETGKRFMGKFKNQSSKDETRSGVGKILGTMKDAIVSTKNFTLAAWHEDKVDRAAVYKVLEKEQDLMLDAKRAQVTRDKAQKERDKKTDPVRSTKVQTGLLASMGDSLKKNVALLAKQFEFSVDAKKDSDFDKIKARGDGKKKGGILGFLGMIAGALGGLLGGLLGGFRSIFGGLLGGLTKIFMGGIEKVLLKFGFDKAAGAVGDMMTPDVPGKGGKAGKGAKGGKAGKLGKGAKAGKGGLFSKFLKGGKVGGIAGKGAGMGAMRGLGAIAGAAAIPLAFLPDIIESVGAFKGGNGKEGLKTIFAGKGPAKTTGGKIGNVALQTIKYAAVGAAIGSVVPGLGTGIGAAIGATIGLGTGVVRQGLVKPILGGVKRALIPKVGKTTGQKVSGMLKQAVAGAVTGFAIGGPAGMLPGLIAGAAIGAGRQGFGKKAAKAAQSFIHGGAQSMVKSVSGAIGRGDKAIQGVVDKVKDLNVQMSSWVEGKVKGAIAWLFSPSPAFAAKIESIKKFFIELPGKFKQGIADLGVSIAKSATDAFNWVKDPNNWKNLGAQFADSMKNLISSIIKSVSGVASSLMAKFMAWIKASPLGKVMSDTYVGDMLEGTGNGNKAQQEELENALNEARKHTKGYSLSKSFEDSARLAKTTGQKLNMEAFVNNSSGGRSQEDIMTGLNSMGAQISSKSMTNFKNFKGTTAEFAKENMKEDLKTAIKNGGAGDPKMLAFFEELGGHLEDIKKEIADEAKRQGKSDEESHRLMDPKKGASRDWLAMSFGGQTHDVWGHSSLATSEG